MPEAHQLSPGNVVPPHKLSSPQIFVDTGNLHPIAGSMTQGKPFTQFLRPRPRGKLSRTARLFHQARDDLLITIQLYLRGTTADLLVVGVGESPGLKNVLLMPAVKVCLALISFAVPNLCKMCKESRNKGRVTKHKRGFCM